MQEFSIDPQSYRIEGLSLPEDRIDPWEKDPSRINSPFQCVLLTGCYPVPRVTINGGIVQEGKKMRLDCRPMVTGSVMPPESICIGHYIWMNIESWQPGPYFRLEEGEEHLLDGCQWVPDMSVGHPFFSVLDESIPFDWHRIYEPDPKTHLYGLVDFGNYMVYPLVYVANQFVLGRGDHILVFPDPYNLDVTPQMYLYSLRLARGVPPR